MSAVASIVVSVLFLLTIGWWGPSYAELGGPVTGVVFVGCVAAWAIFTLQDSVLVGLRSAFWVLVENGIFGVVKIVLLVAVRHRLAAPPRHLRVVDAPGRRGRAAGQHAHLRPPGAPAHRS